MIPLRSEGWDLKMGFVIMKSKFKKEKGKQFSLYQQNKQPPLTLKLLNTKKRPWCFPLEIQVPGLRQVQKCGCVKLVKEIQILPILIIVTFCHFGPISDLMTSAATLDDFKADLTKLPTALIGTTNHCI